MISNTNHRRFYIQNKWYACALPALLKGRNEKMRAELQKTTCFPQSGADLQQGSSPPVPILSHYNFQEFQATGVCFRATKVPAAHLHTPSTPKNPWPKGAGSSYLYVENRSASLLDSKDCLRCHHNNHHLTIRKHPVFKTRALWLARKSFA